MYTVIVGGYTQRDFAIILFQRPDYEFLPYPVSLSYNSWLALKYYVITTCSVHRTGSEYDFFDKTFDSYIILYILCTYIPIHNIVYLPI